MIKVTLGKSISSTNAIRSLIKKPVPVQTAFTLTKIVRELDEHRQDILSVVNKKRDALLEETDPNEHGDKVLPDDVVAELQGEYDALMETVIELAFDRIDPRILGTTMTLTAEEVMQMDWLFKLE